MTFWSKHWILLNFGLSHRAYISLRNNSLWAKIKDKMNEISQKYWNSNKLFTVFFRKTSYFLPDFAQLTKPIRQELGRVGWTILKNKVLAIFNQKDSTISALDWNIWIFQEKTFSFALPSLWAQYLNDHWKVDNQSFSCILNLRK